MNPNLFKLFPEMRKEFKYQKPKKSERKNYKSNIKVTNNNKQLSISISRQNGKSYSFMMDAIYDMFYGGFEDDEVTLFVDSLLELPLEEAMIKLEYYKAGLL